jgi:hypothetical protein
VFEANADRALPKTGVMTVVTVARGIFRQHRRRCVIARHGRRS